MKPKTLLLFGALSVVTAVNAQQSASGYAITAAEKGGRKWKEVKLVDVTAGQALRAVYDSKTETAPLNARTKKPVKKEAAANTTVSKEVLLNSLSSVSKIKPAPVTERKIVNLDDALNNLPEKRVRVRSHVVVRRVNEPASMPFATNSAALAYDKKHDRLYYTPMSINQLRYIDLRSGKIYFFEDEPFGVVKGYGDVQNQVTRMVIASDGNGYALTNDGNHLVRFTTGKKPTITDLGALTDDPANEKLSVHGPGLFGGDMIADAHENLYLVTANRNVFKIAIGSKVATHLGVIKGLPRGFSTNGAMAEGGSKVIVASAESTEGYYRFDLHTLQAEKVSQQGDVFNASDLANGILAFDKEKKNKKEEVPAAAEAKSPAMNETAGRSESSFDNNIAVYPNPITNGATKVSFTDLPAGKYQVQLLDLSGRVVSSQEVNLNNKLQVTDFNIPGVAKGNYLIKVVSKPNKVSATSKVVVQ